VRGIDALVYSTAEFWAGVLGLFDSGTAQHSEAGNGRTVPMR
jgi:hypothetical protein